MATKDFNSLQIKIGRISALTLSFYSVYNFPWDEPLCVFG